jgi:hypothetical protein
VVLVRASPPVDLRKEALDLLELLIGEPKVTVPSGVEA